MAHIDSACCRLANQRKGFGYYIWGKPVTPQARTQLYRRIMELLCFQILQRAAMGRHCLYDMLLPKAQSACSTQEWSREVGAQSL
jgi:hypothetical protein